MFLYSLQENITLLPKKNKMKIGIITDSIDYQPTGIGVYTENLVSNLLKIDKENEYVLIHHRASSHPLYQKSREIRYPFIPKIPKMLQDSLFLSLTKEKFDLVHKPNPTGFLFPVKFKKVLTVFDLNVLNLPNLSSQIFQYLYKKALSRSFLQADAIISTSKFTKNEFIKVYPEYNKKISVIYGGIKKRQSSYCLPKKFLKDKIKTPYLLFVGTICQRKNIQRILDAFEQIKSKKEFNNLSLVMVGQGETRTLVDRVQKLEKEGKVIWTKYLNDECLAGVYKNASLLLYPSLYEGFGFPPLEAMTYKCPIVSSNCSSIPEIVGEAGLLVNPYNVTEIVNAIEKTLKDRLLREKIIKAGLKQVKKFSWVKTARKTLKIYNELQIK